MAKQIMIPKVRTDDYIVYRYSAHLLSHRLNYFPEKNYKIKNYPQHIPKGRAFQFLAKNQELDVIFGGASIERVAKNRAIHFPLIKGLNGWRVALIKANKHHTFLNTETVNELKTYSLGQSHSWSDSQILDFNGFNLIKGSSYKGMYQMLIRDRFDYFPRSVLEIQDDLNKYQDSGIVTEPHIMIHYPSAFYFYVNKHNTELADDIEQGLERALNDGCFDRVFNPFFGDIVLQIQQENRRVFHINNPFLPKKVPLERNELWIDLGQK